jgi:hypothetical protein
MANKYKAQALSIRSLNPMLTARHLPSTAPITEAHPLIPHAHGISLGNFFAMTRRPDGNGQPRKNDSIESSKKAKTSLPPKGQLSAQLNSRSPAMT